MRIDKIDPSRTVMIVVDMQNDFVAEGAPIETPAARATVPKLAEALALCRDVGVRVIYTAHAFIGPTDVTWGCSTTSIR